MRAELSTDVTSCCLGERLLGVAAQRPTATAITTATERISFAELAERSVRSAAALRRTGLDRGDRFAILSRNSATALEMFYAASLSGTVVVPVNHRLAAREVAEIAADSGVAMVFVEDELSELLRDVPAHVRRLRVDVDREGDAHRSWRDDHDVSSPTSRVNIAGDVVLQLYTTGTTGCAKGVLTTEGNLAAMMASFSGTFLLHPGARYLALLPMFHISGGGTPLGVLAAGGQVVMPSGSSPTAVLNDLAERRITHVNLVPSLIAMLLADPATATADLGALEVLMYGAAPSGDTTITEAMRLLPRCAFLHGYGLTECTGGVAYTPPVRASDVNPWLGTIGLAAPGCELRVVDPVTLQNLPAGEPGEVWVRSEQNTTGYWNRPEETAALYAEPGWLRTGDIGVRDEAGVLTLKDRLKDMIISGGENVYSAEVENVLTSHPAVLEAAVYGLPDERWGEAVHASVTLRPGASVTGDDVVQFARGQLAHYKCPKAVEVIAELPRSANGKVLKRLLRNDDSRVKVDTN